MQNMEQGCDKLNHKALGKKKSLEKSKLTFIIVLNAKSKQPTNPKITHPLLIMSHIFQALRAAIRVARPLLCFYPKQLCGPCTASQKGLQLEAQGFLGTGCLLVSERQQRMEPKEIFSSYILLSQLWWIWLRWKMTESLRQNAFQHP